jgi:uncharacterized membrane protein
VTTRKIFFLGICYTITILSVLLLVISLSSAIHRPFLSEQAQPMDTQITTYLQTGDKAVLSEFTANEQSHLKDVRRLLHIAGILFFIGIVILMTHWFTLTYPERLGILLTPLLITLQSIPLLFATSFSLLFERFHQVFFPQGNYAFPVDSLLIQTYPESFFLSMGIVLLVSFIKLQALKLLLLWLMHTRLARNN